MEMNMKLIVGLGNPEDKYKNTFHNLGFMCVDLLAQKLSLQFNKIKCKAQICETLINEKVILAKPQTYMNLSGESVFELMSFYKIALKDLIVVYDDYDINIGSLRIRESGSAGTHNGMRNIIKETGATDFPRVRIGFKPTEETQIPLINYVLSGIKESDKQTLDKTLTLGANALYDFAHGKQIQHIMQSYNTKA